MGYIVREYGKPGAPQAVTNLLNQAGAGNTACYPSKGSGVMDGADGHSRLWIGGTMNQITDIVTLTFGW